MMVSLLHSNGQLRTERYGDTKDVKNLLYSRILITDDAICSNFLNNPRDAAKSGESVVFPQVQNTMCITTTSGLS